MADDTDVAGLFFVFGCLAAAVVVMVCCMVLNDRLLPGYKQGQIDALTGVVRYELVEHDDGTKTWEKKGGE